MRLGIQKILDSLAFDPDQTLQAEEAFKDLGQILGFPAERPDHIYGTGPDVIWKVTDDLHFLVELKTGVHRDDLRIQKKEADKISGDVNWHVKYYPGAKSIPVLIHPERQTRPEATLPPGMIILTPAALEKMKKAVLNWGRAIAHNDCWKKPEMVATQLASENLFGQQAISAFALFPTASTKTTSAQ